MDFGICIQSSQSRYGTILQPVSVLTPFLRDSLPTLLTAGDYSFAFCSYRFFSPQYFIQLESYSMEFLKFTSFM